MMTVARLYFFLMMVIGIEYLTVKYISIVVLKRVLPIIDDFFGLFSLMANITCILYVTFISSHSIGSALTAARYQGAPDLHSHSALPI